MDYKDKIKKLLSLANSPNQHEAEAAMLKAQELMVLHKISEGELVDKEKAEIVTLTVTNGLYTVRGSQWKPHLVRVIAENNCCRSFGNRAAIGSQTIGLKIMGLKDDAEIAKEVAEYAVDFVEGYIQNYKKQLKREGKQTRQINMACQSFGVGFAKGLKEAYETQKSEKGWGLVVSEPREVNEWMKANTKSTRSRAHYSTSNAAYSDGVSAGKEWKPAKRIS